MARITETNIKTNVTREYAVIMGKVSALMFISTCTDVYGEIILDIVARPHEEPPEEYFRESIDVYFKTLQIPNKYYDSFVSGFAETMMFGAKDDLETVIHYAQLYQPILDDAFKNYHTKYRNCYNMSWWHI